MIESWAPIIGAGSIVIGTVLTQLYIHRNTLVEQDRNLIRHELDTVKSLFQLLQKYEMQGKRSKMETMRHQMTPNDLQYLENYFYKYGNLMPESIYEQYLNLIKRDELYQIFGPQNIRIELTKQNNKINGNIGTNSLLNDNLDEFQQIAKRELTRLESEYSNAIGKKPYIWWLRPSWRGPNTRNGK